MKNKIYVVEDMAMTRASIISILNEEGFNVVGSKASAEKAWLEIEKLEIDLVLIDINLAGELDGIWLAQKIRSKYNIAIIFLTAYEDTETLDKILKTDPNGYILKPFDTPTLITNINIAITGVVNNKRQKKQIKIKVDGRYLFLDVDDIIFLKSDGNYVEIILKNKKYVVRNKLVDFNKISDALTQVHRRYIVNIDKIKAINSENLWIEKHEIPISKSFKLSLQEKINRK